MMGRMLARIPVRKVVVALVTVALFALGLWLAWIGFGYETGERPGVGLASTAVLVLAVLFPTFAQIQARERIRLPDSVGGRPLSRDRGLQVRMGVVLVLSLVLPAALVVVPAVALPSYGWLVADVVVVVVALGAIVGDAMHEKVSHLESAPEDAATALQRLCLRADVPIPPLVHHDTDDATAWAEDGRIHLTRGLRERLEPAELEAVLAHELTHLARGDAFVMDVVSAPSRRLLAGTLACFVVIVEDVRIGLVTLVIGIVLLPFALVLAGVNRLLAAALARGRELSADATAAVLTGSPAAGAAALLKLDERSGPPAEDLRGRLALGIIDLKPSWFAPLRTHPPVALRVQRLTELEARLQA